MFIKKHNFKTHQRGRNYADPSLARRASIGAEFPFHNNDRPWCVLAVLRQSATATIVLAIVLASYVAFTNDADAAEALRPLAYNHPGLQVDLGVGLWAWPIPCDADGDGDYDLIVSCPDKPSNGVWLFENATGDTAKNKFPVFKPARRLSRTVHYVMPSYVEGKVRVLSPGYEYPDFLKTGLAERVALPAAVDFYVPVGQQPKGPRVRHNQWRYVDYDDDGALDLIVGIEDWSGCSRISAVRAWRRPAGPRRGDCRRAGRLFACRPVRAAAFKVRPKPNGAIPP